MLRGTVDFRCTGCLGHIIFTLTRNYTLLGTSYYIARVCVFYGYSTSLLRAHRYIVSSHCMMFVEVFFSECMHKTLNLCSPQNCSMHNQTGNIYIYNNTATAACPVIFYFVRRLFSTEYNILIIYSAGDVSSSLSVCVVYIVRA